MPHVAVGADHRGFEHKAYIIEHLAVHGVVWWDCGAETDERSDYPVFAQRVAHGVQEGRYDAGILLCGTGVGMSIAANRYAGVYAGLAWNVEVACAARQDDGCNVLVLPSDYVSLSMVGEMVVAWYTASAKGGRYAERRRMIDNT